MTPILLDVVICVTVLLDIGVEN